MAKVKMSIDQTKPRPRHVCIGLDNDDDTIGVLHPTEYENISPYSEHCRNQGHDVEECKARIRDELYIQRKE